MPLKRSKSKKAFKYNVAELRRSGRKRSQALAIAYKIQRGNKKGRRRRRR